MNNADKVRRLLEKARAHDGHANWNALAAKNIRLRLEDLGKIQDCCTYGYVLPDRCRYNSITGCDCGAYPPVRLQK